MPVPSSQRATSAVISVKPGPARLDHEAAERLPCGAAGGERLGPPIFARLMTPAP